MDGVVYIMILKSFKFFLLVKVKKKRVMLHKNTFYISCDVYSFIQKNRLARVNINTYIDRFKLKVYFY